MEAQTLEKLESKADLIDIFGEKDKINGSEDPAQKTEGNKIFSIEVQRKRFDSIDHNYTGFDVEHAHLIHDLLYKETSA